MLTQIIFCNSFILVADSIVSLSGRIKLGAHVYAKSSGFTERIEDKNFISDLNSDTFGSPMDANKSAN